MATPTSTCAGWPSAAACSPEIKELSTARTILVTGFEPFGGETVNASWEAAKRLDGWRLGELTAVVRLLPCAYDASIAELIYAFETLRPEAVMMTGQAARRAVVSVERFARNWDDAAALDNRGVMRSAVRIAVGAPDRLEAQARVEAIANAIREAGIRARVSRNAGGFVCNHLYFAALQYFRGRKPTTPAVFLHLPATPEQTPPRARATRLSTADAANALKAAAAAMVEL
jgi:pyroglutamyl-peptidase